MSYRCRYEGRRGHRHQVRLRGIDKGPQRSVRSGRFTCYIHMRNCVANRCSRHIFPETQSQMAVRRKRNNARGKFPIVSPGRVLVDRCALLRICSMRQMKKKHRFHCHEFITEHSLSDTYFGILRFLFEYDQITKFS